MTDHRHPKPDSTISRGDHITVLFILIIGAGLGGLTAGLGIIQGIFRLFDPSRYPVELLADVPVKVGEGVLEAHADAMQVTFETLPAGPLWLLSLSDIVGAIALGLVTASFAYVLSRIIGGKPFHRSMQSAAVLAGCAIMFGNLLTQALRGFGQMTIAMDLGAPAEPAFTFEPLPIIVGAAVLALAYVFEAGQRLQRDTEGLV